MNTEIIDLRSDTVTKPTAAMRNAMMVAVVGDDCSREDPSINDLEERVASILGKEAALFTPSGTMANQLAIHVHCRPGDSIMGEAETHCFRYESGAAAALSGVQFDLIPVEAAWNRQAMLDVFRPETGNYSPTRLCIVENTHNRAGGRALNSEELSQITGVARELGVKTHCDGARLWNAAIVTGESERSLASDFDSIAVCFSKGLGAPVGSALCGSFEFIEKARRARRRWGGGMRQAGFLAAAAHYALDHHRQRIAEDHRRAATLRDFIKAELSQSCEVMTVKRPTNLVYFRPKHLSADTCVEALKNQSILVHHMGGGWIRAVLHLHINDNELQMAQQRITRALSR